MWWVQVVEGWLIARLLASPTFHKGVRKVHQTIRHARHGPNLEEMGGTKIDTLNNGNGKTFLKHFVDELKGQVQNGNPPAKKK